jgi:proteasome assembly chaperone (PAC2) family protein
MPVRGASGATIVAEFNGLRDPWLIAAWPGMGNVAVGAAAYLIAKLGAGLVHEIPPDGVFDLQSIDVREGIARAGRVPRSMFFEWRNPQGPRDLLIFIGEAQPPVQGHTFCHRLLDYAQQRGVKRLFTFAALATQLHPSNQPRVFGVTTHPALLDDLRRVEATLLKDGQISGLNGVLLAAGAERSMPGICLLGELPYFAVGVPNPRASQAVLEALAMLSGVPLDFADLKRQGDQVEQGLLQMLERMQEAAQAQGAELNVESADEGDDDEEAAVSGNGSTASALDDAARQRIEALFQAADHDRSKAFPLKQELDRLGVFKDYENRFLDLFKKAD